MKLKVLLVDNPMNNSDVASELVPPDIELTVAPVGSSEFRAALPDVQFVLSSSYPAPGFLDHDFYESTPNLRLLQFLGIGYDKVDIEFARRKGVPICNTGAAKANAGAEHVLLLMLALVRRLVWQQNNVIAGRWRGAGEQNVELHELRGRMLGIIGMGAIGSRVARLGSAFGMTLQYYDRQRLPEGIEDSTGPRFVLLNELLGTSDIVTLHVPLTNDTRHMLGKAELALMKRGAYLVNASRGSVVDEAALYRALSSGAIAGAGLDVYAEEPPDPGNPLFTLGNVVLTAHMACHTCENQYTRFRNAFDNVQRVARGEKPLWLIPELAG